MMMMMMVVRTTLIYIYIAKIGIITAFNRGTKMHSNRAKPKYDQNERERKRVAAND